METIKGTFGLRHAANLTILQSRLNMGEMGINDADNSIWLRDYSNNYVLVTHPSAAYPTGSGTSNKIPKWVTTNSLGDSSISDNGSNVTIASAVTVTGLSTLAGISLSGGSSGQGRIFTTAARGLELQAKTGTSYDFAISSTSGSPNYLLVSPTGTNNISVPNGLLLPYLSSGRIPVVGASGAVTQDHIYWGVTTARIGIGSGASSPASIIDATESNSTLSSIRLVNSNTTATGGANVLISVNGANGGDPYINFNINGIVNWAIGPDNSDADALVFSENNTLGTNNRFRISSIQGRFYGNLLVNGQTQLDSILNVAGATTLTSTLAVTSTATFTAAPVFSSATASQALFTNGSKALVSNPITGSGNVVMSASPTLTGTISAEAATFSTNVTVTGTLTLSGGTANRLLFLNGSKVASTSGSLTWDGANLSVSGSINPTNLSASNNLSGANLTVSAQSVLSGTTSISGIFLLSSSLIVGSGGSDFSNEVSINVSGKNLIKLAPTGANQTYKLTNPTTDQTIVIINTSTVDSVLVDLGDGSGTYTQYIIPTRMAVLYYSGSLWYSTY